MRKYQQKSGRYLFFYVLIISPLLISSNCIRKQEFPEKKNTPTAKQVPHKLTLHGHTRIDDYYWLNNRADHAVIDYIEAENEYAQNAMRHTLSLQEDLLEEFQNLSEQPNQPITYRHGAYLYFSRNEKGGQYPAYCRKRDVKEAEVEVLIDTVQLATGHDVFALADMQISPEQDILAYGVDTSGQRDVFNFCFKDLRSGENLTDVIPDAHRLVAWANDNRTVYYVRNHSMYRHQLGTDPSTDKVLLDDVSFIYKSKSAQYVLIFSARYPWEWKGYLSASDPSAHIIEITSSHSISQCFRLDHRGDKFYFLDNGRLMEISVGSKRLEDVIETSFHQNDAYVEHFEIFNDYIVLWEKEGLETKLRVMSFQDGLTQEVDFSDSIFTVTDGKTRDLAFRSFCNSDFDGHILRFGYSSTTTPETVYDYNMETGVKRLVSQQKLGGGFDPSDFCSELIWATAKDGTSLPVSLVYRNDKKMEGGNPLLLNVYGMYGVSEELKFSPFILSLLNRGFIFAIAHVRGGGEFPGWHEEGMLLKKKNSFMDFVACARYLIDQGYAHPKKLFARGESGGGLLIAGVITMAPELFYGAIIEVPFLDIITTMLEEDQKDNIIELGNPSDKKYYDYMLSYAPYENIRERNYPNILITAGFYDTHVYYWSAAKFVAKLRAKKTDSNRLLLKTNMTGGHAGAEFQGALNRLREWAFKYAFLLDLAGIQE